MNSELEKFRTTLSKKMWITSGSRFEARRRLESLHQWSFRSTALLTGYILCLTAGVAFLGDEVSARASKYVNLFGFSISLFLLIFRLLEHANKHQVRAERLHQSGIQIASMEQEISTILAKKNKDDWKIEELRKLEDRYSKHLSNVAENHDPIDKDSFKASQPAHFNLDESDIERISKLIKRQRLPYLIAISAPPLVFVIMLIIL